MREICDKHFPDNWVIPIYGGEIVDVTQYWAGFPAAIKALQNNIEMDRIKTLALAHS
jgi:WASH complex subunit strumpellin